MKYHNSLGRLSDCLAWVWECLDTDLSGIERRCIADPDQWLSASCHLLYANTVYLEYISMLIRVGL